MEPIDWVEKPNGRDGRPFGGCLLLRYDHGIIIGRGLGHTSRHRSLGFARPPRSSARCFTSTLDAAPKHHMDLIDEAMVAIQPSTIVPSPHKQPQGRGGIFGGRGEARRGGLGLGLGALE